MDAIELVKTYYAYFNHGDWEGMRSLLDENIRHEPNQGTPRTGIALFKEFQEHMDKCYEETLTDMVFFGEPEGRKVAVEFVVNGTYKVTDEGLPEATGQTYVLPAAAFLEVNNGKITRITTYYNLPLWESLVGN
ncbi:nuclear transport factor 2 family protein [Leadbetterella sp. DM7]|uniref:nuclear transport factor 2 family protein n=1 Tax=Leadbetterella sp. DM7 TaxID=3235085 RepID=UPI00349E5435